MMIQEEIQQLRSRATELLIREEWHQSIQICTQLISLCQIHLTNLQSNPNLDLDESKISKALVLAYSNRAESWSKLKHLDASLADCEEVLRIESGHYKTLMRKGKILLGLKLYGLASECFKLALLDLQVNGDLEEVNGYVKKCERLDLVAKSGTFDVSGWILGGFQGRVLELGEYVGPVEIKRSNFGGRGLFVTKNVEVGGVVVVSEATAVFRGVVNEFSENGQLVIWSSFVEKVMKCVENCGQVRRFVSCLSSGECEDGLEVPDIDEFRPESKLKDLKIGKVENSKILSVLDVNSMVENVAGAKVLGSSVGLYGVGLWTLPSFVNHSCCPNVRRLHIGDHLLVVASRDIMAGEELTFAYFDVFMSLEKRREMLRTWGFECRCRRCVFEEGLGSKMEMREIEIGIERGMEAGNAVNKLEESLKKWGLRGIEKGFCRASFWGAYVGTYGCERTMRKWGRRIPAIESVVESVAGAVGSDERLLKLVVEGLKNVGGGTVYGGAAVVEIERAFKLGRGIFGKTMKKQAMKSLLGLGVRKN